MNLLLLLEDENDNPTPDPSVYERALDDASLLTLEDGSIRTIDQP